MVETLLDREINKNRSIEHSKDNSEYIVSDFKIENHYVFLQSLTNEKWHEIARLDDLVNNNIDSILNDYSENLILSSEIKDILSNIRKELNSVWDEQSQMFRLSYSLNKYDQFHQLYIPLNAEYLDDIVIKTIYDKNGKFVSKDLEQKIDEPLYRLYTQELYVDSIIKDEATIYKKGKIDFNEIYEKSIHSSLSHVLNMNEVDGLKGAMNIFLVTSILSITPVLSLLVGVPEEFFLICLSLILPAVIYIAVISITLLIPLCILISISRGFIYSGEEKYVPLYE